MSVLPAGQSLARFLPDAEDLLHDPRAYLIREPLTIGPRQMYGLASLFGIAGGAFLASCVLAGPGEGERMALGIGLLIAASVWLGWSLMMRGHSLVLYAEGVEIKYRDTAVWCPWALFNVDGHAFVPESDSPRVGLTLPVWDEAVPFIELRREDTPIAHGAQIKARQWQLIGSDTVVLPARYAVMAGELGELLLQLGRKLGRQLPKGTPPPDAYAAQTGDDGPMAPDARGWITIHLTRLAFPPVCCDCGEYTNRTMPFHIASNWDRMTSILVQDAQPLEVPIPVCDACQQRIRERQHQGGARGINIGAGIFGGLAIVMAMSQGVKEVSSVLVIALGAAAAGGLMGFIFGTLAAKRLPAELGRYSPSRGTLSLRFRNGEYAARVLDAVRSKTEGLP